MKTLDKINDMITKKRIDLVSVVIITKVVPKITVYPVFKKYLLKKYPKYQQLKPLFDNQKEIIF